MIRKSKKKSFAEIKDWIWHMLQSCKEKILSQGEKEVLLKAVTLSIPTYMMSCFKLPDTFCDDLSRMMAHFWWGQKEDERKIYSVNWDKCCSPKCFGGMVFKDPTLLALNKG